MYSATFNLSAMAKIATYNTHYEAYAEMLGKPNIHSVFEYILDAHSAHVRMNKKTDLVVSVNDISKKRHISRNTVSMAIKSLVDTGIISVDKKDSFSNSTIRCTVNIDRYVSLINAFIDLKSTEKGKFSEALFEGDDDKLQKMGYVLLENAEKDFLSLKGVPTIESCSNLNNLFKNEQVVQNIASCSNLNNLVGHFESFRPKVVQNIATLVQNIATQYGGDPEKLFNFEQLVQNIASEKVKNEIYQASCSFLSNPMQFYIENPYLGLLIFEQLVAQNIATPCSNLNNSLLNFEQQYNNKYNNNKLTSSEEENVLSGKNQSCSSEDSLPVHLESSHLELEDGELDLDILNHSISSYQKSKSKSRLPFIPEKDVEDYIADLANCLDRADKIFINQVWDTLQPFFVYDESDANGGAVEKQQDPEGMCFFADRILQDIITPAYESTMDIINGGAIIVNGQECPVTASELKPEEVQDIIDWQIKTMDGEAVYVISKKRFKNIFAEEIPVVKRKSIREGRGEDKLYMQKIILIGDDDNRYKDLTPIELVVYNFLNEHFQINDDGSIEQPNAPYLNRINLNRFYLSMKEKKVTEQDFLGILFNNRPDSSDGSLQLKGRMFSADQIREWNSFYGHISVVDELDEGLFHQDRKMSAEVN